MIYFVEVQFQRDDDIYWRIITEAFLYINQYKPQRRCKQYYFLLNAVSIQAYHSSIKHH
nr:DUF2887 domain-containing protein [Nostoc linckia]